MTFEYRERESGIYRSKFVRVEETEFTDKATGEVVKRWRWVFQELSDPTTVGEMDTLTSRNFKPRSNGLKLFMGILGRPPVQGDDPAKHYGTIVDVVYGPNQNGRLTVTDCKRVNDAFLSPAPVSVAPAAPQVMGEAGPETVTPPELP